MKTETRIKRESGERDSVTELHYSTFLISKYYSAYTVSGNLFLVNLCLNALFLLKCILMTPLTSNNNEDLDV